MCRSVLLLRQTKFAEFLEDNFLNCPRDLEDRITMYCQKLYLG